MQDVFDVFFSYHWRDHAAVERIAQAVINRGIGVFLDRWYLAPGQPWPQTLEATIARCRAVAVFLGAEGLGPWQQREKNLALDRQGREPGFPVIPVLLSRTDPPLGFLKLNTWVDLSAGATDDTALEILTAAIRGEPPGPEVGRKVESARATICPYRGLRPFREEDELFFFGRAAFTETLMTTFARQSFIAVVGASGSGKSSVVRAGLIPRLRRGGDGRMWEAVSFVPTDRPLASLAASLLPLLEPDLTEVDRLAEVGKLARHLAEGEIRLRDVTSRILAKQPGTERLLLFADQWEELYTLCPDEAICAAFVGQLLEVAQAAAVTVVLTLRGDFYGRALSDRPLSDQLQDAVVNVGPMTRDELAETITRPAEKMGLAFEPGLVETILEEVGDEPGNLPLLEFLLEALWKERRGTLLHYDAYQKLGRVTGAITHRADEVFTRELDDRQREAAHRLLIRMVRPGEGFEDTRQRAAMPAADPVAETTIRKLADARLVVTERDAVSGDETVEIAHEALIRGWQRLQGWINQDREFLRTRDRIAAQARLWENEGKPLDRLLPPGRPLAEGEDLIAKRRIDLDADLLTYIEASTTAAKAEEDTQRAVQLRRLRRARLVSAAMGLLALVAISGGTIAWWARGEANRNAEQARAAQAKAEKNFIYAMQLSDTGLTAAALATLLKYQHGDSVSETDIVKELSSRSEYSKQAELVTVRSGFSLLDAKRCVDNRGYPGIGYGRLRFTDLVEKAPLIVPVNDNNLNRYVIFRGVIRDIVLLSDPHFGNRTMRRDDFERAWLDYGEVMGKIGFVVKRPDGTAQPTQLNPSGNDFIIDLNGDGELLLTNVQGEKIGFVEGKYVDQISDAELFDDPNDDRWRPPLFFEFQYAEEDQLPEAFEISSKVPPVIAKVKDTKAARRYYFHKNSELTAEVSGTAAGTYDFVKTKEDAIVQLLRVPTADNVKDTILVSEGGELSITFDAGSNRDGKYNLSISHHLDQWTLSNLSLMSRTQFQARNLSVMPGATINYQINWEALHAGEKGVMIKVDKNSDGNVEFENTVSANLDDTVAPTTIGHISGTRLRTGSYLPGATFTLIATDNDGGIGVDKTEYSLDNGSSWTNYTAPVVFNGAGEITLMYRSRDGLGNAESANLSRSALPSHHIQPSIAAKDKGFYEIGSLPLPLP